MSRAAEQAFAALSQYFLDRLAARSRAEFESEEQMKREQQKMAAWRSEQAAIGETDRRIEKRLVGGQLMEMDVAKKWDPNTNSRVEVVYGARPATEEVKPHRPIKVVGADGQHRLVRSPDEMKEGDRFYDAVANRPQRTGGGAKEKRVWVERGGEPVYVPETSVQPGDKPWRSETPATPRRTGKPESPLHDGRSKTGAYALQQGDPVRDEAGNVIGAPVFVMPGGAKPMEQKVGPKAASQSEPQLDEAAQITLRNAKAVIEANPSAKDAIKEQLRANGYDELIPLL
jgi:hypothetical protein